MLTILLGTDWTVNRDEILKLVAQDVHNRKGGRILMVPELISHDMERRLCETAGDTSSRYAQVLSFSRLVRRVSEFVGVAAEDCLDNGGRVVAMAAAVRQLHSKLKAYASVGTRPEFLTGLVDAVDEFKRCCIGADDLRSASQRAEGALAQKLEELSLILEAYDSFCMRGKKDPRDQMTWLLEIMEDSSFASDHVFYIDGFPDFTRQHAAILEHLIVESSHVTVSLNCDRAGSKAMAFEKAGKTASDLIAFAKREDVPFEIRIIEPARTVLQPVRDRLFQGKIEYCEQLNNALTLRRADGVYDECRGAAARILELVRHGARFRDIGVVCADMPGYENAIRLAFERSGIPLYRSGTDEILQKSVIGSILCALETALEGFERREVLRYSKSILSPLTQEECDLLENYSYVWAISGNGWVNIWKEHPAGLGANWSEEDQHKLLRLNDARQRLTDPLIHLRDGFREAKVLADQVLAIYRFFEEIGLADRLGALADQMDASGDNRSAQILNQLWEILLTSLEQLYDVLGETAWDQDSFTRLFTLLLGQYNVGTIPTVLDAVVTGPVSAMRCHQVKHLLVLGVREGKLPGYSGSSGVLTDREREALRDLNVPLTGGGLEGLQSEFADIYGVFCGASETITVTYGSGQPSFLYNRLSGLVGGDEVMGDTEPMTLTRRIDAAAYLAALADQEAAEALGLQDEYNWITDKTDYGLGKVSSEHISRLYGNHMRLSASRIDKQAECRLSYYLQYGLKIRELKEAAVDPAEFGTYIHWVLEQTAQAVMAKGGFHAVSLNETLELARKFSDEYIEAQFKSLDSSRMSYLLARNVQELNFIATELWNELSVSLFEPVGFEVSFGTRDDSELPDVKIPGAAIETSLNGYVDRVDLWNNGSNRYFRVVDYKTGSKTFDYCDVLVGTGLQMLLYMYALEQGGAHLLGTNPVPVGVQYFPAKYPVIAMDGLSTEDAVIKKRLSRDILLRKGLLLKDSSVLEAVEPEGAPKRMTARISDEEAKCKFVADREQMKQLRKYVFHVIRKLIGQIASGVVDPNPYRRGNNHDACKFCAYKTVCNPATVCGVRNYEETDAERFWQEVGKELNQDG